ncbi:MAG: hypothetical protein AAB527_00695, partial [Patescibacteria group bacterium]
DASGAGGVLLRANGGNGGANNGNTPGIGGTASGGAINFSGGNGQNVINVADEGSFGGAGGGSPRGGSGGFGSPGNGAANRAGFSGVTPGGGGGGATGINAAAVGGNGGKGLVVVWSLSGTNGGDLAEFFVVEDGVEAGDVVAVGPNDTSYNSQGHLQKTAVLKKATPEDRVVGVVSTNPWQVMNHELFDQHSADVQPIALSGTAHAKVSTANGPIRKGDTLAPSDVPGVAVRADKAGLIIGSALEDFPSAASSTELGIATSTPQTGKVLMFVSTTYSTGSRTKAVLANYGVDMDSIPADVDTGRLLLAQMLSHKQEITASSTLSEIYTDRLMAGLEIISPRVLTDTLVVNAIEPVDKNITMKIAEGGKLIFIRAGPGQMSMTFGSTSPPTASTTPILTIDDIGNAIFSGAITIGSRDRPSGITLYDTVTGEPYCVKIAQGALVHIAGECIISELFGTSTPAVLPSAESPPPAEESSPTPVEETTSATEPAPTEESAPVVEEPVPAPPSEESPPAEEPPATEESSPPAVEETPPPEPAPASEPTPEPALLPPAEESPAPSA